MPKIDYSVYDRKIDQYMTVLNLSQIFFIVSSIASIFLLIYLFGIYKKKMGFTFYRAVILITTTLSVCLSIVFLFLLIYIDNTDSYVNTYTSLRNKFPKNILGFSLIFLISELIILLVISVLLYYKKVSIKNTILDNVILVLKILLVIFMIGFVCFSYFIHLFSRIFPHSICIILMIFNILSKIVFSSFLISKCNAIKNIGVEFRF